MLHAFRIREVFTTLTARALATNWLAASSAFLIVLGAMVLTVEHFGVSVPFYDEWDAEAQALYKPYETGSLVWTHLFSPHNGHIIFFTRLTALVLYIVNEAWDPRLQMLVSGLLHALTAAFLIMSCNRLSANLSSRLLLPFTVALFAMPFSWMSILVAFQTQFYFMILFSLIALWLLCSRYFLSGYVVVILAYLSMTPGAFVLPAFTAVLLIDACRTRRLERTTLLHISFSMILFIMLVALHLNNTSTTDNYSARDVSSFLVSLVSALCWPFRARNIVGLLMYVPFVLWLARSFYIKAEHRFHLGIGLFVVIQIVAMAWLRGADGVPPSNRYWELLLLGIWINGVCLVYLLRGSCSIVLKALAATWIVCMTLGMSGLAHDSISGGLPERKAQSELAGKLIREYLTSHDPTVFSGYSGLEISYPDRDALLRIISDPTVEQLLPSRINGGTPGRLSVNIHWLFQAVWMLTFFGLSILFFAAPARNGRRKLAARHSYSGSSL